MKEKLQWGLGHAVPAHAPVAWGARAIINATSPFFDLLPDRQSCVGTDPLKAAMRRALNPLGGYDGYLADAQHTYSELAHRGRVRGDKQRSLVLVHDKAHFLVVADTRASCGYLYVAAWFDVDHDVDLDQALRHGDPGYADEGIDRPRWSDSEAAPAVGSDVSANLGGHFFRATVVGYHHACGYLAALVVPYEPFLNPDRLPAVYVCGSDIIHEE